MTEKISSDVVVIGGGPGGYVAAIRATQLGNNVSLIEKDRLGGVCTNWGCIPTKALLHVCKVIDNIEKSEKFGIKVDNYLVDYGASMIWANSVVNRMSKGVEHLLNKNGIKVLKGFGKLKDKNMVDVRLNDGGGLSIEAKKIIIATGSSPSKPPIEGIDSDNVITSDDVFKMDHTPKAICIIGGGAVGLEFATIFKSFGSQVTVLEMLPNILPNEDEEASKLLKQILKRKGITIINEAKVKKIKKTKGLEIYYEAEGSEQRLEVDTTLIATGRRPCINGIGLERLGLKVQEGRLLVDEHLRTNIPNIYAIGDVANKWMLAHVAMQEGITAAENAIGQDSTINYRHVPRCVYTMPELASVGLSELEAKKENADIEKATYPLIANGRAITLDEKNGLIKIVFVKKTGEILGVQIIAPEASELIHEFVIANELEATIEEVANIIHAHPTLSEISREVTLRALNRSIHV